MSFDSARMRSRGLMAVVASALATLALSVADADADAVPMGLGQVGDTGVVVDEAGTGYVTWSEELGNQILHYCRLAQGATSCNASQSFTYTDTLGGPLDLGNAPVLTGDGRVLIADSRCCITGDSGSRFVYTSSDGGATFTPPEPSAANHVGSGANGMRGTVLFAAADSFDPAIHAERLLTIADGSITNGADFQSTATTASTGTAHFGINPDSSVVGTGSSSIAVQGTTLLAAYTDTDRKVFTRRYNGGGAENTAANWSAPLFVADAGEYNSQVLAGPPGTPIYLVYPDTKKTVVLRKYTGSDWGPPVALTNPGIDFFAASEDSAGIIHLAYVDTDGNFKYRYARSAANDDFTNPQVLADFTSSYFNPKLSVNAAGYGFVVWNDNLGGRVLPIAPGEGPAGNDTMLGDRAPVDPTTDLVLSIPANCVPTDSSFKVSLALKQVQGHRAAAAGKKTKNKLVSAAFYKGKQLVVKAKKKPFGATISTKGSSGTLTITAKVKISVKKPGHKAKSVKRTLKAFVLVCS